MAFRSCAVRQRVWSDVGRYRSMDDTIAAVVDKGLQPQEIPKHNTTNDILDDRFRKPMPME